MGHIAPSGNLFTPPGSWVIMNCAFRIRSDSTLNLPLNRSITNNMSSKLGKKYNENGSPRTNQGFLFLSGKLNK